MLDEQGHLECEMEELRLEIKDNAERIDKLCDILKRNNEKLRALKQLNTNIKENLKSIQHFAVLALDKHKNSTERFGGVNYGDLQVVDVYVKYSIHDEDAVYGVLIEECSPTAYELLDYMVEYLKEHLPDYLRDYVYVETEW